MGLLEFINIFLLYNKIKPSEIEIEFTNNDGQKTMLPNSKGFHFTSELTAPVYPITAKNLKNILRDFIVNVEFLQRR